MAKLQNTKWEIDQSARIKKLENDLKQQKARIDRLEKRADTDDTKMKSLKNEIEKLKKRK